MKASSSFFILFLLLLFMNESQAQSNLIFSVSSNPSINLGLKMQNVVLFLGTDFSYTSDKTKFTFATETTEDEYSVFSIKPGIGIKIYFSEDDLSPFISGILKKEIPVSVDVKGEMNSKAEIEERYDDFSYIVSAGGDFKIKDSILLGFEVGLNIWPSDYKADVIDSESIHISTFSNVTLTYVFQ